MDLLFDMGIGSTSSIEVRLPPSPEIRLATDFGSEGAVVGPLAEDRCTVALAASRGLPACPNMLQLRVDGCAERELCLEVAFDHPAPKGIFDEYPHSATADFRSFLPLAWADDRNGHRNRLIIPPTGWDRFYVGMQYPLPLFALERLMDEWAAHPDVYVDEIGRSREDRPLYRVTVAAAGRPEAERPHHLIANFHPGEGNARWRMVGMLRWLLQPAAASARREHIFEFHFLLSPDGPANGWRRVQADGVDMNRCFLPDGPDATAQPAEAFAFQTHMEKWIQAPARAKTLWCMHTWPGLVEPIFDGLGPEFMANTDEALRPFGDLLARLDTHGRIKRPVLRSEPGNASTWNSGAFRRYGITSVLVEGGGDLLPLQDHLAIGGDLGRAITTFWKPSPFDHA